MNDEVDGYDIGEEEDTAADLIAAAAIQLEDAAAALGKMLESVEEPSQELAKTATSARQAAKRLEELLQRQNQGLEAQGAMIRDVIEHGLRAAEVRLEAAVTRALRERATPSVSSVRTGQRVWPKMLASAVAGAAALFLGAQYVS